jgi:hypothetical protein
MELFIYLFIFGGEFQGKITIIIPMMKADVDKKTNHLQETT